MSVQSAEIIAQVGRYAAHFAHRATERVSFRRPGAADWEMRLAARRGVDGVMPRLATSLHRLLGEFPRKDIRSTGQTEGQRPLTEDGHPIEGPSRPLRMYGLNVARQATLLRQHDVSLTPALRLRIRDPLIVQHSVEHLAKMPRKIAALPSPLPREPALRHMSPTALRGRLIRQSGMGEMLTSSLREKLRPHLKFDPAMARLHQGATVSSAARDLNAEAFTIGPDVFFAEGRYSPETRRGLGLLAHELTHVGQQAALIGDKMRFFTPQGGDAMEREAQQTAAQTLEADDREKANRTGGALHQSSAPPKPELAFTLSSARSSSGSASIPAQKATEESGQAGAKVNPAQADARAVTDRIYELMKQEIALGRERGASRRRG